VAVLLLVVVVVVDCCSVWLQGKAAVMTLAAACTRE
jgi:hypothetical protein